MTDLFKTMVSLLDSEADDQTIWTGHLGRAFRARAGQILFHALDPSDAVYLLLEGEARAFVGRSGSSQTTLLLRAPVLLGDRDILAGYTARETVQLVTSGRVLLWERESFEQQWQDQSPLRQWLTRDMARRFAAALLWADLERTSLAHRLASILHQGSSLGWKRVPAAAYLALLTGAATKSVTRSLADLRRDRALHQTESSYSIDPTVLTELDGELGDVFHQLRKEDRPSPA